MNEEKWYDLGSNPYSEKDKPTFLDLLVSSVAPWVRTVVIIGLVFLLQAGLKRVGLDWASWMVTGAFCFWAVQDFARDWRER